ncbi:MAG: glycoside hydrolase family 16 protein, partial [Lentisphaerota bacterium]
MMTYFMPVRLVLHGFALFLLAVLLPATAPGKTLSWAGQNWNIKNGSGLGPGPNNWSDSTNSVWVDTNGWLHLKIRSQAGLWYCSEITSAASFSHGEYRFNIATEYDKFDTNVVGGLFTYLDDTNEIDIEFTRAWTGTNNANFATQPSGPAGNHLYYYAKFTEGNYSTHRFIWETNSIYYQSYFGHADPPPASNLAIASWTYTGSNIPPESTEKLHLNMWLFKGRAPTATQYLELVVNDFVYIPSTNSAATQQVNAVFYDDFNDANYADKWGAVNDPALSLQTNGLLRIKTDNYGDDQSGLVTLNLLNWNAASGCVFQARLHSIDVVQTNTFDRTDVRTLLAAVTDGRFRGTVFFATNSACLLGSYVGMSNQYRLSFLTKTNSA